MRVTWIRQEDHELLNIRFFVSAVHFEPVGRRMDVGSVSKVVILFDAGTGLRNCFPEKCFDAPCALIPGGAVRCGAARCGAARRCIGAAV